MGSEVALRVEVSVISWAGVGIRMDCSGRIAHIGSGGASVGVVGCTWWRGANVKNLAAVPRPPVGAAYINTGRGR